ncbi:MULTISPECIES: hotdog fold thioesterase [Bacillaceae]|uniref:hotdog fold thioesterase n=2 Tax=Bacillales TaxID=1385 RepID=UPI001E46C551|nr:MULTISPECIES: hotdog fold thioesterase [Bacillaceae]MCE4050279.1 hotdog fold thioesterase [Bacillus sp. Au-Bac7]MCM3029514.1 hotdog fold thioesterase [Niallia sp. MER 6]MDL0435180.1 hotdog fold thioesterase [Niallia sp. SS-2023]UPO87054.1 hotdog fold thioesterase [Niallia sp. Man26]
MHMKFTNENTLMERLGIEITEVKEDGTCIATMPVDERTRQPFGYLHGGASVALAETVASLGAASLVDLESTAVFGQEINANHIRSKKDGIVTAIASVIHQGKSSMVYEIKIQDEEGKLISISRCTIAVVNKRK